MIQKSAHEGFLSSPHWCELLSNKAHAPKYRSQGTYKGSIIVYKKMK